MKLTGSSMIPRDRIKQNCWFTMQ